MYHRVDEVQRMTDIEASVHYPDSYIAVRRDSMYGETGTVLYVGDNMGELISLIVERDDAHYGILEGLNLRCNMERVIFGG